MRIVGELEVHRPAVVEAILDLGQDLIVGEIGQEREAALGDAHGNSPEVQLAGVPVGSCEDRRSVEETALRRDHAE